MLTVPRLAALAIAATALLAPTARAADHTVSSAALKWTIANDYVSGGPTRTFLGYITNTTGGGASNGSVTAAGPAAITGPAGAVTTIDGSAARGADQLYTFAFPGSTGTYSDAGVGEIPLTGTLNWTTHGIPIPFADPVVKLNGLTGELDASGAKVFDLDLSSALVNTRADGSKLITGIVPVEAAGSALAGFGPGSRRDGTMSLNLGLAPVTTQAAPAGPAGPAGPQGPKGADGRLSTFRLAKAPFKGTATRSVKLLQRRTGKLLATGFVRSRTLKLVHTTTLKGSYVLKAGTRRAVITLHA